MDVCPTQHDKGPHTPNSRHNTNKKSASSSHAAELSRKVRGKTVISYVTLKRPNSTKASLPTLASRRISLSLPRSVPLSLSLVEEEGEGRRERRSSPAGGLGMWVPPLLFFHFFFSFFFG